MKPAILALAAALTLPLAACSQESLTDREFGRKVRAYLLEHPEVLQEVSQKLQEKQQAEGVKAAAAAIEKHRRALERDPDDFVANPNGKVTVVEFYDYNCGYCKQISPEVLALIRDNPDVRFVFKEFVIFGALSERAARAALLAKDAGRFLPVHQALMAEKPLTEEAIDRILRQNGVDPARLDDPATTARLTPKLAKVQTLAASMSRQMTQPYTIEGTPAFIVGDTLVPGADIEALKAAIARARGR